MARIEAAMGTALTVVAGVALSATAPPPPTPVEPAALPARFLEPIEVRKDQGANEANKKRRKAWMRELHKAPPGVDWKAIEARRGQQRTLERMAKLREGFRGGEGGTWTERGSNNQAGRMHHSAVGSDGALYAGSNLGGLWRGTTDGDDWEPLGDGIYGGVHELAVLPPDVEGDPDILVVTNSSAYFWRSTDGGVTWDAADDGLPTDFFWVKQLVRTADEEDPTLFLLAASYSEETRLYRSTDKGASWESVLEMGWYYGDVWVPRDEPGGVWVLGDSAGAGYLYYSDDNGDSFEQVSQIGSYSSRGYLAGSEAGALYASIYDSGYTWRIHRSTDDGETFDYQGVPDEFWGEFAASITDPDLVAWGGVEVYISRDGGASASAVNDWWAYYYDVENSLHADLFGLDVVPDGAGGETWFIGTDGGLFRSDDGVGTVQNLSMEGLRVSQYYDTLTDADDHDLISAGAQDQGYQLTNTMDQDDELFEYEQIISGDYAHNVSGDGTHELVYSTYPGTVGDGTWEILVQIGEEGFDWAYLYFPDEMGDHAWLPPLVADPEDREVFYVLGEQVHRYTRTSRWEWATDLLSDKSFSRADGEYITAMRFAPSDPEQVYLATSEGRLFYSSDRGESWTKSSDIGPDAQYFYGNAMAVSREDPLTAYVGGSGYDSVVPVYRTSDGGKNWDALDDGLGATLVYELVVADDGSEIVFAATQQAAYRLDPGEDTWVDITGTVGPMTTYWSVEALHDASTVRFATYGRGVWDYSWDSTTADTGDTEEPSDTEDPPTDSDAPTDDESDTDTDGTIEPGDCGCASGGSGALWWAPLVLVGLRRRRR